MGISLGCVDKERISHDINHLVLSHESGIMWKCQIGYRLKSMPFAAHIPFCGMRTHQIRYYFE